MKILTILFIILFILTGCSQQPTTSTPPLEEPPSVTQQSSEQDINPDFISKIQNKEEYLKNKKEEDTTYVIYSYDGNSFNTSTFSVPKEDKYNQLALQTSKNIGLENLLPNSITKNESKITIDLSSEIIIYFNNNLKNEIIFLESYAKTFSENLGGLVYFTVNENNYESNHMYFGLDEHYPLTTDLF